MPLNPGARLGHYHVTALLGEGGMGQVWQATDTQLNRQIALSRASQCRLSSEVFIDPSVRRQEYIEDCQVCCRPITLTVTLGGLDGPDGIDDGDAHVEARTEEN